MIFFSVLTVEFDAELFQNESAEVKGLRLELILHRIVL